MVAGAKARRKTAGAQSRPKSASKKRGLSTCACSQKWANRRRKNRAKSTAEKGPKLSKAETEVGFVEHFDVMENYGKQVIDNFGLYRIFLMLTFRWPFAFDVNKRGIYKTRFMWKSVQTVVLFISTIFYTIVLVQLSINFIQIVTPDINTLLKLGPNIIRNKSHLKEKQKVLADAFEWELVCRHWILIIPLMTALAHNAVAGIFLFIRRDAVVEFFNLWGASVRAVKLNLGMSIYKHSAQMYCSMFGILILFFLLLLTVNSPNSKSGPVVMAAVLFRSFHAFMLAPTADGSSEKLVIGQSTLSTYQIVAVIFFLYMYICSKILVFYFIFSCKLLQKAIRIWSARTHGVLMEQHKNKLSQADYAVMWKEHCVLIQLHKVTCDLTIGTIEPYFYFTMSYLSWFLYFIILCYEVERGDPHKFPNSTSIGFAEAQHSFSRDTDIYPAIIFFSLEVWFWYYSSWIASKTGADGVTLISNTLRERVFNGEHIKGEHEYNLVVSLFWSLGNLNGWSIELNALCFTFSTVLGRGDVMLTYLIIWYQLNYEFDSIDEEHRDEIGIFLWRLEGLPFCHWNYEAFRRLHDGLNATTYNCTDRYF